MYLWGFLDVRVKFENVQVSDLLLSATSVGIITSARLTHYVATT